MDLDDLRGTGYHNVQVDGLESDKVCPFHIASELGKYRARGYTLERSLLASLKRARRP